MILRPEPSNFRECHSIVRGRIDSRARAAALAPHGSCERSVGVLSAAGCIVEALPPQRRGRPRRFPTKRAPMKGGKVGGSFMGRSPGITREGPYLALSVPRSREILM